MSNHTQKTQKTQKSETPNGERNTHTLYLVICALMVALTFVVTWLVNIPAAFILGAGGNINLGDTVIFLAAAVLGPVGGAVAGGLGSMVADLVSGYVMYAPFTLIVKGLEGLLCGFLCRYAFGNLRPTVRRIIAMSLSVVLMIVGYFFAEIILQAIYGGETFAAMLIMGLRTLPANLLQGVVSAVIALIVLPRVPDIYFNGLDKPNRGKD